MKNMKDMKKGRKGFFTIKRAKDNNTTRVGKVWLSKAKIRIMARQRPYRLKPVY